MLAKLRQAILHINAVGESRSEASTLRKLAISAGKVARKPADLLAAAEGLAEVAQRHHAEISSWVGPDILAAGNGGPFDACDLRHWLVLADRAGVPFVPAQEILHLNEDELDLLSGQVELPSTPATRRLRAAATHLAEGMEVPASPAPSIDTEQLEERLYAAMDDLPEGWMVRSNRCGGSELKALAGVGLIGETTPEVRFGANLEIGPGWIRVGNRRRVNTSDKRTVAAAAQGPGFLVFLARPWVESSRYLEAPDPHRENSPFAGNGRWPAEWRAFVEDGEVVGVASYYGWADQPSPETARTALEVRDLAQRIVNEALAQKAWPRFPDIELAREAPFIKADPALDYQLNTVLGRETVSCTLDFIETKDGLMLLEGGPPNSPIGGGHPCAFAGTGGPPRMGCIMPTRGVAFQTMEGVLIADPATWQEGDRTNRILDWEEVEALSREES